MEFHLCLSNGVINIMTELQWPLMHNNITRSDLDKMIEYLKQDDPKLTHGPLVKKFEEEWSKWLGVRHSVMLNSGSSANDLTMMAVRELKGPGEVIVPPLTWVSDISSVLRAGLKPVFVDIDPQSLAVDSKKVLEAITPNTRAVFLTHILGYNGLTDELITGLKERKISLIEDVCESHGATHNSIKVGTFGWASNFSFYYAHHMTTIEGGIISTDDDELYRTLRLLRNHGFENRDTVVMLGCNSRLDTIQAVVGNCMAQGIIIGATNRSVPGYNNTLCLSPALISTKDDLDQITSSMDKAITEVFG